jgi:hypothetical protein
MDTKGLTELTGRVLLGMVTDLADLQEKMASVQILIATLAREHGIKMVEPEPV